MSISVTLAARLRTERQLCELSVSEAAARAGVHRNHLTLIETGRNTNRPKNERAVGMHVRTLIRLRRAYPDMDMDALFDALDAALEAEEDAEENVEAVA